MRRLVAIILIICLCVSMSACGYFQDDRDSGNDEVDIVAGEVESHETDAPVHNHVEDNITNSIDLSYVMREEIIEFPLVDGTVFYRNAITYPYFTGESQVGNLLNEKYYNMVKTYKDNTTDYDQMFNEINEIYSDFIPDISLPFYDNVEAVVTYCDNGTLSLYEVTTEWHNGAHTYYYVSGFCYDISTAEQLELKDIIIGTDQEREELLSKYMGDIQEEYITNSAYYFTEEGLCLFIRCGEASIPYEIIIPYTNPDSYKISAQALLNSYSDTETDVQETNYSLYIPVLQDVLEKEALGETGEGLLFDIDGNGIDELIVVYTANMDFGYGYGEFLYMVCELYTISNGKAIAVSDVLEIYAQAGGPSGSVRIMQINGDNYFAITSENGETGGYPTSHWGGDWQVFTVEGTEMETSFEIDFEYTIDHSNNDAILYEESSATINGNDISYKDYEQRLSAWTTLQEVDGYLDSDMIIIKDDGLSIGELIALLENRI